MAYWLANLAYIITSSHLCVSLPQVTMLRACPSMTLAVERDLKPQPSLYYYRIGMTQSFVCARQIYL